MTESSRRGFLRTAGVGVAAAGAAAVVPTALAGSANAATPGRNTEADQTLPAAAKGSLAAYVDDVHGDEMTVMVEGREVVVHDRALVTRLARHMHAR